MIRRLWRALRQPLARPYSEFPPLAVSFELPTRERLLRVEEGQFVKIVFAHGRYRERLWLRLVARPSSQIWIGRVASDPVVIGLSMGALVKFHPLQVIEIDERQHVDHRCEQEVS
jgi:hypothetical protein